MKRILALILVASLLLSTASIASAGDEEWATAGKILVGLIGLNALFGYNAPTPSVYYYSQQPSVVVVQPQQPSCVVLPPYSTSTSYIYYYRPSTSTCYTETIICY